MENIWLVRDHLAPSTFVVAALYLLCLHIGSHRKYRLAILPAVLLLSVHVSGAYLGIFLGILLTGLRLAILGYSSRNVLPVFVHMSASGPDAAELWRGVKRACASRIHLNNQPVLRI